MAERGAFFEGGREPFPGGKKVPFPPQTPPILPKTAHMLFCPTGQSLLRDVRRPKKSGKNAAGNGYFVSKVSARQVSTKPGGRIPAPASTKKGGTFSLLIIVVRRVTPVLIPCPHKTKADRPQVVQSHAFGSTPGNKKRGCLSGQPLMSGFWGRRGSGGGNPFLPLAKGVSSPSLYLS